MGGTRAHRPQLHPLGRGGVTVQVLVSRLRPSAARRAGGGQAPLGVCREPRRPVLGTPRTGPRRVRRLDGQQSAPPGRRRRVGRRAVERRQGRARSRPCAALQGDRPGPPSVATRRADLDRAGRRRRVVSHPRPAPGMRGVRRLFGRRADVAPAAGLGRIRRPDHGQHDPARLGCRDPALGALAAAAHHAQAPGHRRQLLDRLRRLDLPGVRPGPGRARSARHAVRPALHGGDLRRRLRGTAQRLGRGAGGPRRHVGGAAARLLPRRAAMDQG